jgi:SOS response regulatory protein OraA/RecX
LEKRYRTTLGVEKGRRRAIKALQRLGYAYGDIREALREFPMQESEEYEIGEVE